MEVLKKTVNLKNFVKKVGGVNEPYAEPCVSADTFVYPYDIDVTDLTNFIAEPEFPHYKYILKVSGQIKETTAVKYETFFHLYVWLRKFIMESQYFTPKIWRGRTIWSEIGKNADYKVEDGLGKYDLFFNTGTSIVTELDTELSGECNETILCVNPSAETFYINMLTTADTAVNNAFDIVTYAENNVFTGDYQKAQRMVVFNKGETKYNNVYPFIEIPLLIDNDIEDIGYEHLYWPEEWQSNVTYAASALVTYNGWIYERTSNSPTSKAAPGAVGAHIWKMLSKINIDEPLENMYYTESKLDTLARPKTSVDDDGNVLPFIFNPDSPMGELRYLTGSPCNIVYDDKISAFTYDIISSITIGNIEENDNTIVFKYVVGNMIKNISSASTYTTDTSGGGILYEEAYQYKISTRAFNYNGVVYTVDYYDIDYTTGYKPGQAEDGKRYAKAYIANAGELSLDWPINSMGTIRYDALIGTTDVKFSSDEIKINRGASASYEAFNIIGEVNSLEDIEKYHNDWFRIKGKND